MTTQHTAAILNAVPETGPLPSGWFLDGCGVPAADQALWQDARPTLFSATRLWVDETDLAGMTEAIAVIESVLASTAYQAAFAERFALPVPPAPRSPGVLYGYDFHLSPAGPKLIEINTNAGGALLNAVLGDAWQAHAGSAGCAPDRASLVDMFAREWGHVSADEAKPAGLLVIVDEQPAGQYLYPEFVLCADWLTRAGWQVAIADPAGLVWDGTRLLLAGQRVDMVYNRLTDFSLAGAALQGLRQAHEAGAVLLTPAPDAHARMADKRHLITLADQDFLQSLGIPTAEVQVLARALPACRKVCPEQAESLWAARKQGFFKPVAGFGSRAAYRGDKLTRRVFEEILAGDYIMQASIPPSERAVQVGDAVQHLKVDVRNYTYCGQVLGVAGRLYHGQTTNFRTPGGGFAPVYSASPPTS